MPLRKLVVALVLAGFALAATVRSPQLGRAAPYLVPLAAVMASASYGGLGSGLATSAALVVGLWYFLFVAPRTVLGIGSADDLLRLGLFALVAFLITGVVTRGRRTAATLQATLGSIDAGVIVTDRQARVTFLNPVAERLTGWSLSEARGRAVGNIYRTLNEQTREPVTDRIEGMLRDSALREGMVLGPRTERLLVSTQGVECPIVDVGSSVVDEQGDRIGAVVVFRDISESRAAATALRQSEAMKAAAFDAALDCVITMDHLGRVVDFNPAAEHVFGYRKKDAVGRLLADLIVPEDLRGDHRRGLARYLEGGEAAMIGRLIESRAVRADGTEFPVELSIAKLPSAGPDKPALFTGFLRDITERVRTVEALDEARVTAERANRLKDEFLATVSHELRTPLNAVQGWTKMLLRRSLSPDQSVRALDAIDRNARALTHLVSDLLDVSRIVTGQLRLHPQDTDAARVVRESLESMRPAIAAKRLELTIDMDTVPLTRVDPDRLRQIVWNLLSNAIKFTPPAGRIIVTVCQAESQVRIAVSDTGQGIDRALLPFVFNRFWQADSAATRTVGGLGLGLAIVRHLVEAHAGTVTAESAGLNHGTTFTVSLPAVLSDSRAAEMPPLTSASDDRGLHGVRVLAVDDEVDSLDLVAAALSRKGASVRTARSADEALRMFTADAPDVLIADIGMPGTDGYALVREVRRQPAGAMIPVVALTAYAGQPEREAALEAGFTEHVGKPVDPDQLASLVADLAKRQLGPT